MAFTNFSVGCGELHDSKRAKVSSAIATAAASGVTSLSALGGEKALGVACHAFITAYRNFDRDTQRLLSANRTVTCAVSATSSLVTVQFQLIAAV